MARSEGAAVRIEIVEILGGGGCPMGLTVGRAWVVEDSLVPEGMCAWAYNSIFPFLTALRCDGRFWWCEDRPVRVCCPDADNPVVFTLGSVE